MGVSVSTAVPKNAVETPARWVGTLTGFRHVIDDIQTGVTGVSQTVPWEWDAIKLFKEREASGQGPIKLKIMNPVPLEVWGPFPKKYAKVAGLMTHTLPEKIDGVPILSQCRHIRQFLRTTDQSLLANPALQVALRSKPSCWEDTSTPFDFGGQWYYIIVNHPEFYLSLLNNNGLFGILGKFMGGRRRRRKTSKRKRVSRATRARSH